MVEYGLGDYRVELGEWAKHYKEISTHVKREYFDGETIESKEIELQRVVKENESTLIAKEGTLLNYETFESRTATDYYLPLKNLDYKHSDVEHYSIGASNTSHEINVRIVFKIDYTDFILDYMYETSGTYAESFYSVVTNLDEIIETLAYDERGMVKTGIEAGEDEDYNIIGIDENKRPIEFEISERELLDSLVAVEIYEYNMTIH